MSQGLATAGAGGEWELFSPETASFAGHEFFGLPFHPFGDCDVCSALEQHLIDTSETLAENAGGTDALTKWGNFMNQVRGGSLHVMGPSSVSYLVPVEAEHGRVTRDGLRRVFPLRRFHLSERRDPVLGPVPFFVQDRDRPCFSVSDVVCLKYILDNHDFVSVWPEGNRLRDKAWVMTMSLEYQVGLGPTC